MKIQRERKQQPGCILAAKGLKSPGFVVFLTDENQGWSTVDSLR